MSDKDYKFRQQALRRDLLRFLHFTSEGVLRLDQDQIGHVDPASLIEGFRLLGLDLNSAYFALDQFGFLQGEQVFFELDQAAHLWPWPLFDFGKTRDTPGHTSGSDDTSERKRAYSRSFQPQFYSQDLAEAIADKPRLRQEASAMLDAVDSFSNLLCEAERIDDIDGQYVYLKTSLSRFIDENPVDGLLEVQRFILDPTRDAQMRALLMQATSSIDLSESERSLPHLQFIIGKALGSDSHFVRSAALTAALVSESDPSVVQNAAQVEKLPRLRARMEKVAHKLESKRLEATASRAQ